MTFSHHQEEFFRSYLQSLGEEVTEAALQQMYIEANTYVLASHFLWGLWSILQNEMSTIQFGFLVSFALALFLLMISSINSFVYIYICIGSYMSCHSILTFMKQDLEMLLTSIEPTG